MPKTKWCGTKPEKCDICGGKFKKVFYDAKTVHGPWGLLCGDCHANYGYGLGMGRGQMYNLKTLNKIGG